MDASELASKMLQAEQKHNELVSLEKEIVEAVLELKETQKVGKVKVAYTAGRRELDWTTPGQLAPKDVIEMYTTRNKSTNWQSVCMAAEVDQVFINRYTEEIVSVDYATVCKEAKIDPVVLKEGTPTAKISYA